MKKKIITVLLLLLAVIKTLPVKAANYELKELIPADIETTIVTDHFSYKSFYYNSNKDKSKKNYVVFKAIKNRSDEALPVTISIALFDKDRENIGTINYCSKEEGITLQPDEEKPYAIEVKKDYLAKGTKVKDVKYIAILSENIRCRTSGSQESVGQTVEEIGIGKNNTLDSKTELMLKVFGAVAIFIIAVFVYAFGFTNTFENMDGNDVRQGYKSYNKELKAEREFEERTNPKPVPVPKETKTEQVKQQEQQAANEDKTGTDLHNMYK